MCGKTQNAPKRGMVDAILFPTDANTPRIVKLEYTMERDENTGMAWMRLHDSHWFALPGAILELTVQAGDHDLIIRFSDKFLVDGSPINRCMRHLLRGRKCTRPWGSSILAVRADTRIGPWVEPHYRSAHISDVARVVNEFVALDRAIQR
jgi:hypothetical protein